ncbi:MAG TPA: bifunctional phosphoribosylaminoimidazolecarboxamide formyltransferase/IMP cyclohydrolase [Dictyobacter sp.]|jgi:phosphoribosylaminoimidazolecarboxamide formyltransferase/IMP cyclohydrolase|nr:bifunctional phosphoribosylaminoimidazolecarboxamide formyltransferase/IMP cyclohydrolase [Dictyobacter sp.]
MKAILSVANREGLTELARELQSHEVTLFATDETRRTLQSEDIVAQPISTLTHCSDVTVGRMEAAHPAIYAGIVAQRRHTKQMKELKTHHWQPIDVVVVNLADRVAHPDEDVSSDSGLANVQDSSLLRAAATNFQDVLVLTHPDDYAPVMQEWREQGEVSLETRRRLAATALQYIASYDAAVAHYLQNSSGERFPAEMTISLQRLLPLRYGENPHQQAAFYRWSGGPTTVPTIAEAEVLQGKELSYNNLLDLDVALKVVQCFTAPTVVIVKHTNPCGVGCGDALLEAYKKAHAGDPISSFEGVIGSNRPIDQATAQAISHLPYEAVIAPEFTPEALHILGHFKGIRLLATHRPILPRSVKSQTTHTDWLEARSIGGGILLQTPDLIGDGDVEYRVVTDRDPTLDEVTDLIFAWKVVRNVKSNAVVLARKLMVLGVGAGQMSRAASVHLALAKADVRARGSVLASDAAFPFPDGIEAAAKAGVTAIIQPGGAVRDEEAIRVANKSAIAMVFTGKRHFRH